MEASAIDRFCIHAPYYINLASLEGRIRHSSIRVIREELERGSILGARYVMFHPGSYTNQTLPEATKTVRAGLEEILDGYRGSCGLLVEISAGSGNVLGDTFEEVADMITTVRDAAGFAGVCFDTCHAFASGYDFRTPAKLADMLRNFDDAIGLKLLKMTHVNDSKAELGGHKDRHEHVGKGHIGSAGLEQILTSIPFRDIDWILETETDGRKDDIAALQHIREGAR
jgi:deoxyribonuclease-4